MLGFFFAFLILELGLRTIHFLGTQNLLGFKPIYTTLEWVEHPMLGKVLLKPNSSGWFVTPSKEYSNFIKVNNEGFFDVDHQINKPKDTFRIVLLGDSFVQNVQTELKNSIGKSIENLLQKNLPKRIEVISIGMGDTGTTQQYLALKEFGLKYQPDLVIHFFLTANDLKNNSNTLQNDPYRPYFILQGNDLKLISAQRKPISFHQTIKERIKSLKTVTLVLMLRQKFLESKTNRLLGYPLDYQVYKSDYSNDFQDSWEVTQRIILKTKDLAMKNNSKYLLVTLANNEQVNQDLWMELNKIYPSLSEAALDLEKPEKLFKKFCSDSNAFCFQLLPEFLEFAKKNPQTKTHFKYDGHWNQSGIDIATNSITSYLLSKKDYFFSTK